MKDILDLHCRPQEMNDIDQEIQHMLFHLDELVRQEPATYAPPTIYGLGQSLDFFANVDAGHESPHQNNHSPTSERAIVLGTARALRKGQQEAEAKIHAIEKQLGVTRMVFPAIPSWDSLHPGVSTEEVMRDILHDYHKGYIDRALDDTNPNPYDRSTDYEALREKKWKVTERLIEIEWKMFGLAPIQQINAPSSRPSYGTPSHPPKRLMEIILELAEEHHAQQLSALHKAFEPLDFLELPHPLLQAEPPLHEIRRVHSTKGQIWELLYDLLTDVLRVELAQQEYSQAYHEMLMCRLEPDGKRKMEHIEGKYSLPPGNGSLLRFDRDVMKELMMACRENKDHDGTPESTTASSRG
jgi:hypothetical protein